jgi:ferredoxin-NADP reductase
MLREFESTVIDIITRTHDIWSFRFSCPEDIVFKPGQFFFLTILVNGQEATKHFSFSNSPTEKGYIEFTKRLSDSEFSRALTILKKGDWARIRMPYGFFTFEGEHDRIACLAAGIGITAIRSICAYARDKKLPADIILLYGNRSEQDIAFRDDFEHMGKDNNHFKVLYTLSKPLHPDSWQGTTGRISAEMIRENIPDLHERVFYLCGPPQMVEDMKTILLNGLSVSRDKIKVELFTGYAS